MGAESKKATKTKKSGQVVKEPKIIPKGAKQRKKPIYKSLRLHPRIKHHGPKLPSWWRLIQKSLRLMAVNKKQLLIFFIIFAVLNILLVRGIESTLDVSGIEEIMNEVVDKDTASLATGFTALGLLLGSSSSVAEVTQLYQLILMTIATLSIIWLYRQQQAGNKVSLRMALYRGMYPLIPFILVLLVIGLQMLPALAGNFLFQTVLRADLIVNTLELVLWVLIFVSTLLLSLYMITSSSVALFVVTLPEMTPMKALREARELVRYRRLAIIGRILGLLLTLVATLFVVVLPVIFFAPLVAEWLFFSLTVMAVPFVVGYGFSLYRELL